MSVLRTIACDWPGCDCQLTEKVYGDGHPGWAMVQGVTLNGVDNPSFCPGHKSQIMNFIDSNTPDDCTVGEVLTRSQRHDKIRESKNKQG